MNIIKTKYLSAEQQKQIKHLTDACRVAEPVTLSYPFGDAFYHYLLYIEDSQLAAVIAVIGEGDWAGEPGGGELECLGFTGPEWRRQGCFSRLLDCLVEDVPETDIIFPVQACSADALAVMAAIGADCLSTEYRMECVLEPCSDEGDLGLADRDVCSCDLAGVDGFRLETVNDDSWNLLSDMHGVVGHCRVTEEGTGLCLHHVEIDSHFRRQGYGQRMIDLLLTALQGDERKVLFLHVGGDNPAAVGLYKKTGFLVTETLSYFLY